MKTLLIFGLIFLTTCSFSQDYSCSCLVKLNNNTLRNVIGQRDIPSKYNPIIYKNNVGYAYNLIIKDSASYWFIKPYNELFKGEYKMKKLFFTFRIDVKFNGVDSLPIYEKPDINSKILSYLKPEPKFENAFWFFACKKDFAKIKSYEQNTTGWINSKYYSQK